MGITDDWLDGDFDTLCDIAEACSIEGAVCDPSHLLGVMWVEGSGARADAKNPYSSATGLIQWMKPSWSGWGYTRESFCELGVTGQLRFIRIWFMPYRGKLTTAARVYTAVFLPAFVSQSVDPQFVLCASDSERKALRDAYLWNRYFDKNQDGKVQVWELEQAIRLELAQGGDRCGELFRRLNAAMAARSAKAQRDYVPNVQPAAGWVVERKGG